MTKEEREWLLPAHSMAGQQSRPPAALVAPVPVHPPGAPPTVPCSMKRQVHAMGVMCEARKSAAPVMPFSGSKRSRMRILKELMRNMKSKPGVWFGAHLQGGALGERARFSAAGCPAWRSPRAEGGRSISSATTSGGDMLRHLADIGQDDDLPLERA